MSASRPIAGVILAGGESRRMGEDKSGLKLAGTPLIQRAIDRLKPQVSDIVVNVHDEAKGLAAYGLPIVTDTPGRHQGPLAGILASLHWAEKNGIGLIATIAVDTPFFPKDLVGRLVDASHDKAMAAASSGGRLHAVFGLWYTDLADELQFEMEERGLRSARQWVALHDTGIAQWPSEPYDPFFNINRPEDMNTALQILREHQP